ncbi:SPOR domain-containing protein [Photobacterium nomapromontoriensis]|uniref:SPOR domain-containing protein n=1 Tax=Photobacterium nomapromontoriensis TaxID=2910237 RepID=UPI003D12283A
MMKKLAVLAVATVLAGCASDTQLTQLVSSSSEEVYSGGQSETIINNDDLTVSKNIAESEVVIQDQTVEATPAKKTQVLVNDHVEQPKPVIYKYAEPSQSGYTIQVLALSHNKGFTNYVNKLPSDQPVWMNEKDLHGVPWFTLLYGHFDTKDQARRALKALPQDVLDFGPFIRDLAVIKKSPNPKLTKLH